LCPLSRPLQEAPNSALWSRPSRPLRGASGRGRSPQALIVRRAPRSSRSDPPPAPAPFPGPWGRRIGDVVEESDGDLMSDGGRYRRAPRGVPGAAVSALPIGRLSGKEKERFVYDVVRGLRWAGFFSCRAALRRCLWPRRRLLHRRRSLISSSCKDAKRLNI
jgi:hypothetical protein